ncbi:acylneuraminate cytidylyltransferase family protein [Aquirufa sp. ROCK2-A2]
MKPLVVIPARSGSKGVPLKNIKLLGSKPLIHYTIEAARTLFSDDQILVSTDGEEIKQVVEQTGLKIPFLRPDHLSQDNSGTYEVLLHAIEWVESTGYFPDCLILLQATSPFRSGNQIQEAMDLYDDSLDMVISVKETKSNPYFVLMEENEEGFLEKSKIGKFTRRQDAPAVFELNGAIYVMNVQSLKNGPISSFQRIKKYVMDELSSHDIDTELDWLVAETILQKRS